MLSHGHYDHTGGLPGVLALSPDVRVHVHPAATDPRYSLHHGKARSIGMPDAARRALEGHWLDHVHWLAGPVELTHGVSVVSHIPRMTDGEDAGGPFFKDAAGVDPDPIDDDLALCITSNRGLIVVVGCCHAGLVNTLRHALAWTRQTRLHAVLGGFHLAHASQTRLDRTIDALAELHPDHVVPCHCPGELAADRLKRRFGDHITPGIAGMVYSFGGAQPTVTSEDVR